MNVGFIILWIREKILIKFSPYNRGREPMAREPYMAFPVTAYGSQTILS